MSKAKSLNLITFSTIMQEPIQEVNWLLKPLIGKGDRALLYGEWGSFKSWLLMDLGLHLAAGIPWLNQFHISSPQSVLYIDEEMNEGNFRLRLQMLAQGAGVYGQDLHFRLLSRPGITFDEQGAITLLNSLKEKQFAPDVIIVETLRRVMVGDEKEASEVAAFWRNVQPLLEEKRTLILSHHMRKATQRGNNSVRDRASGSTDIMAGLDSAVAVTLAKKEFKAVTLHHTKSRWDEEIPSITIRLEVDNEKKVAKWVEIGTQEPSADNSGPEKNAVKALEIWLIWNQKFIVTSGEVIKIFTEEGMAPRSAERLLKKYHQQQGWTALKRGTWQIPSPSPKPQDQVA